MSRPTTARRGCRYSELSISELVIGDRSSDRVICHIYLTIYLAISQCTGAISYFFGLVTSTRRDS